MANILFIASGIRFASIPGYPGYAADEVGGVWSSWMPRRRVIGDRWRRLRPGVNTAGYHQVALYADGKRHYIHVACLVLLAFVGPPGPLEEARHGDGARGNNRLDNLCWGTKSENAQDRERHRLLREVLAKMARDGQNG